MIYVSNYVGLLNNTLVGSDGNVRIWSTRSGLLLHCLQSRPSTESDDNISHIAYTESLGGSNGKPAILVTGRNSLLLYHM